MVGKGKQAGVLEQFVRTQTELTQTSVDQADDFENAQVKLAERVYDLVLFAQDEPETQTARMIQELQLQGKRMPLLFLPGTLAHGPGVELHGDAGSHAAESALIRTIRGAVALGRAEQQRREVEDTFGTLYSAIEQSADMVLITDSSGVIEYVNPAFEKITGYARAEVIGQTPRILKSGEQSPELYRELWAKITAGEVYRGVLVNRKKTGESFVVEKTITPVRNAAGRVTHFISNDRDISERRRLEADRDAPPI